MQVYPQVCDQVRPVFAGWPTLDMPAVCAVVERLGYQPGDWSMLLRQLRCIHAIIGEMRSDGQPH
jgi:hypothetical protein